MKLQFYIFIATLQIIYTDQIYSQADPIRPESPVLNLVSVNQPAGSVVLAWSLSPSPDVSGYVVYSYLNGAGYEPDTLYDPFVTNYIRGSVSPYFSESFVVAAIDSSGNISPLSNELHTIFTKAVIDTCNKKIELTWNSYSSYPKQVTGYTVLFSENGGSYYEAGEVPAEKNNLVISDFATNAQYCFIVRANLEGGNVSTSNKVCILTKMQKPPQWINSDYATVDANNYISLAFTIDPFSEITHFRLERKSGPSGTFQVIAQPVSSDESVLFTDNQADVKIVNNYRLSAINNCNIPVTVSNLSSNMVLSLERTGNDLNLSWNSCKDWSGMVSSYWLFINTGNGFEKKVELQSTDTVFTLGYKEIMYEVTGSEVCFYISASETSNPYGVNGLSLSSTVCTIPTEIITVPNVFTPNSGTKNAYFRPRLSFTPLDYQLVISDRRGNILFETRDYNAEWDGSQNGNPQPQGVCLWFLKVTTPSGKSISKTGTLTIINSR